MILYQRIFFLIKILAPKIDLDPALKKLLHKSLKIVHINFVFNSSNKLYDITRIISSEDPFVSLGNLQTDPLTQNLLDILSSPPQSQSKFKRKSWEDETMVLPLSVST